MEFDDTSRHIVDSALRIHIDVGPGMLESTYESMLEYELTERGLYVRRQVYLPMQYRKLRIEKAFCVDLLVNNCVIIEVKSVEKLVAVHEKQLVTYLKMANLRTGFLINFSQITLKAGGIRRITNALAPNK